VNLFPNSNRCHSSLALPSALDDSGLGHARNRKSTVARKINLQAIVSEHYAAVYRFGFALAKNESDAADLMQETFLSLAKHHEHVRDPERIRCWLFTTLRREFLRRVRTRAAHPEVQFRPEEHEIPAIRPGALRLIDAKEVFAALEQVDESYRSALKLFYRGDLSYKEISATLGVPIGTVMSRLSRGKEQLRRALATTLESGPDKIIPLTKHRSSTVGDEQRTSQGMSECVPSRTSRGNGPDATRKRFFLSDFDVTPQEEPATSDPEFGAMASRSGRI
jgi:RNA polymerase sigma factor (sigma-70 family)